MIYFKDLRWKNFLSTGNSFTEINLTKAPSTLVVGHNGAGKSTMLDALSFALFGKPHRNINKPMLINTINNKHCVVEVEFTIGQYDFKVVRGIRPNIFEIWQNGTMINQDSKSRDYQKFLETNILKLNHKSFHQIVVLGSSSFIPFMQLPSNQRREVIEDLLDINIFSKMNNLLRENNSTVKEQLKNYDYEVNLNREKVELQKKYIRDMTEIRTDFVEKQNEKIKRLSNQAIELIESNSTLTKEIQEVSIDNLTAQRDTLQKSINNNSRKQGQIQQQMNDLVKEAKFYDNNDSCPTCTQSIGEELKAAKMSNIKEEASNVNTLSDSVEVDLLSFNSDLNKVLTSIGLIDDKQRFILQNNNAIIDIKSQIKTLEEDIESSSQTGDVAAANRDYEELINNKNALAEKKLELIEKRTYLEVCLEMLKDTGIKTKIIREYLPVMNNLINRYLQVLDFFVQFEIDEAFNETIKSRYRDSFNYSSFSEGEKSRIDLALLFTWRQIARMKNSVATNLLILDETFDSSLDYDGIDNLLKILDTLEDGTNTFIISHKGDILDGKFADKIEFKKERNFSIIS